MRERLGHVPALDGLRGVAIAVVLAYHAGWLSGGFLGVDLFFVLSGFLITTLLLEEHDASGSISLRRFYGRRARRLFPVAFAGLAFCVVVWIAVAVFAGGHSLRHELLGAALSAFYLENFAHFLHPPATRTIGHFWTLSQEEQFYLLWPPLLMLLLRRHVSRRRLMLGLAAVVVVVAVHRGMLAHGDWKRFYYAPDTHSDGIVLGCLLAVASASDLMRRIRGWSVLALSAFCVFAAELATLHVDAATALYGLTIANLTAAVLIASVVLAPRALTTRLLGFVPLTWLGLISYSLYIWQSIIGAMTGLTGVSLIAASIAVAALSYRYIERPLRRGHRRRVGLAAPPVASPAAG